MHVILPASHITQPAWGEEVKGSDGVRGMLMRTAGVHQGVAAGPSLVPGLKWQVFPTEVAASVAGASACAGAQNEHPEVESFCTPVRNCSVYQRGLLNSVQP